MQPGGRLAVLGEERALYPVRVAALEEAQDEDFLALDFGDALDLHLAGAGAHAGAAGGAGQAGDLFHGLAVDVVGLGQGYLEVVLGAGIPEHVEAPKEDPYDAAHRLWENGDVDSALEILTELNRQDPENMKVLIDLAQLKAETGDLETAEQVLDSLPPEEKLQHQAKQLAARIKFMKQAGELPPVAELQKKLEADPKNAEALHQLALQHVLRDENAEAMDLLIRLMQADSTYKDGIAKTTLIELFDKLGNNNPDVRTYRRKLYTLMH